MTKIEGTERTILQGHQYPMRHHVASYIEKMEFGERRQERIEKSDYVKWYHNRGTVKFLHWVEIKIMILMYHV